MSQTSVSSDLLESLQVLSELGVDTVGDELSPVAFTDISLSVEEPLGNVVIYRRKHQHVAIASYRWAWQGCR